MSMLHNTLQVKQGVHKWHLALVCSRTSSSWTLKYKHMILAINMLNNIKMQTIISSIPMCYAKCHNVNEHSLGNVTCVNESFHVDNYQMWQFQISEHLVLGTLQIVHVTLTTINGVVLVLKLERPTYITISFFSVLSPSLAITEIFKRSTFSTTITKECVLNMELHIKHKPSRVCGWRGGGARCKRSCWVFAPLLLASPEERKKIVGWTTMTSSNN